MLPAQESARLVMYDSSDLNELSLFSTNNGLYKLSIHRMTQVTVGMIRPGTLGTPPKESSAAAGWAVSAIARTFYWIGLPTLG